ncbi:hypothetical protein DLM78_15385 [Leptospira stimsonii]|uniref:Uncharacterized protein n=1 Tax=Leptospira stimsonii TaxID=2202203 RepID=A0A8B3CNI6_9LEPT|nr:hypothetical protein DLM78_15385 [Leptospira stimsonii]
MGRETFHGQTSELRQERFWGNSSWKKCESVIEKKSLVLSTAHPSTQVQGGARNVSRSNVGTPTIPPYSNFSRLVK